MKSAVIVRILTLLTAVLCGSSVVAQIVPPPISDLPPIGVINPGPDWPPTVAPSASGPYYAVPSWDQTLAPNVRFVILTNMNSQAVLDRETGLVWARASLTSSDGKTFFTWRDASSNCSKLHIAGRGGWRLPSASELGSLIDMTVPAAPHIPAGHPFVLTPLSSFSGRNYFYFWTGDVIDYNRSDGLPTVATFIDSDPTEKPWTNIPCAILELFRDAGRQLPDCGLVCSRAEPLRSPNRWRTEGSGTFAARI